MANLEERKLFTKFLNSKIPIVKKYEFKCAVIDKGHDPHTFYNNCEAIVFVDRAFSWEDTVSGYYYWSGVNMMWRNELVKFYTDINHTVNPNAKCISIW